jgi:hypothetical protein
MTLRPSAIWTTAPKIFVQGADCRIYDSLSRNTRPAATKIVRRSDRLKNGGLKTDPSEAYATELKADALAVGAMAQAGFDPSALVRYIERIKPNQAYTVYTPLPDRDQRVANMRTAIEHLPRLSYDAPTVEFTGVKEQVRRITEHQTPFAAPPTLMRN